MTSMLPFIVKNSTNYVHFDYIKLDFVFGFDFE